MAAVIIEITTRGRGQPQYRRVRSFPYSVGRALDNDLILADETVSAHHVQLEQSAGGQLRVRNLSHENGTSLQQRSLGFVPEDLKLPASLQLGHSTLRLLDPRMPVEPTRRHHHYPGPLQLAHKLAFACFLLLLVQVLNWWQLSVLTASANSLQQIALQMAPQIMAPVLMALITGFVSRLLLHRWQFALQLTIACMASLAMFASTELQQRAAYFYSSDQAALWCSRLFIATAYVLILAWQLRAFSLLSQSRALLTSAAILWGFLAVILIQEQAQAPAFSDQPDMQLSLRVDDSRALPTLSVAAFIADMQEALSQDLQGQEAEPAKEVPLSALKGAGAPKIQP